MTAPGSARGRNHPLRLRSVAIFVCLAGIVATAIALVLLLSRPRIVEEQVRGAVVVLLRGEVTELLGHAVAAEDVPQGLTSALERRIAFVLSAMNGPLPELVARVVDRLC